MAIPHLELTGGGDTLSLDGIRQSGTGVQAQPGVSGLGLPKWQVQWFEGAGDGAVARGRRLLPRDIDIPLYILGTSNADLRSYISRLADILDDTCTLHVYDSAGTEWTTSCELVGGGDYVYGTDTKGLKDCRTVITLRSGDGLFHNGGTTAKFVV
jgi:hypothetical protein